MKVRIMKATHNNAWYKNYLYQVFDVYEIKERKNMFFISPDTPDLEPRLSGKVLLKDDVDVIGENNEN